VRYSPIQKELFKGFLEIPQESFTPEIASSQKIFRYKAKVRTPIHYLDMGLLETVLQKERG
jgi:hypothetical protein